MTGNSARRRAILFLAAALAPSSAWADRFWVGGVTANWNNSANWSLTLGGAGGQSVPGAGEFVYLRNNDAINRNIILDVNTPTFSRLRFGNSSTGVTTLTQASNFSVSSVAEFLGSSATGLNGSGVHTQSAGLNTVTLFMTLGDDGGSGCGTYNLSGSGSIILNGTGTVTGATAGLFVGNNESGVFNQDGGSVTVGTASALLPLYVGNDPTGVGTYNLTAGALTVKGFEVIGNQGVGTFNQSGGTATVANMVVASSVNTTGNYLLSAGGLLIVGGEEDIGFGSNGTFNQSGGGHSVNTLYLGFITAGNGTYVLSSGALTAADEHVGHAGSANFNQSGGTNNCTTLYLASNTGGTGTYLLSNSGALTVTGTEYVGYLDGAGTFNQSGGVNTCANLYIAFNAGGTGTYLLSGGALNAGAGVVGAHGTGAFIQTGGTMNAAALTVGGGLTPGPNGAGYYNLQDGTLNVSGTEIVGGIFSPAGTFNQQGGTHSVGSLVVGSQGAGTFLLSGGTLLVAAGERLGSSQDGTFLQSGGMHIVGSPLAPANLNLGYIHGGQYLLSGTGSLTVWGDLIVGLSNPIFFGQSAGAATVNGNAYLGGDAISKSTADATISISSSGSMSITGLLKIWDNPFHSVDLSNGYLGVGSINTDGNPSRFNWTGGTFAITRGLTIGPGGGLGPVANFSGGTFLNQGVTTLTGGSTIGPAILVNQNLLTGFGTLGGSGGIVNSGLIQPSGGNFNVTNTGSFSNTGNIELTAGAQLQLNGGSLSNSGAIALNNSSITGIATLVNNRDGVVYGSGNLSAPLVNNGLIQLDSGNLNVPAFSNAGVIELAGGAANLRGGALVNADLIEGFGKVSNALTNIAQIKAVNGTLILAGPLTNSVTGQIVAPVGGNILLQSAPNPNFGLISLLGGTYDSNGQSLFNPSTGVISGRGTLRTAGLMNNGSMSFSAGLADVFGAVNNNSRITVTAASTTTFYNDVTTTVGSITVNTGCTVAFLGSVSGVSKISGPGLKDFEGAASGGPIATVVGDSIVGAAGVVSADYLNEDDVQVYGSLSITGPTVSRVNTLGIFAGRLDLMNNDLVVANAPLATIAAYIDSAYSNGSWTGNGLTSSQAAAIAANLSNLHKTALGYATASSINASSFDGQPVAGSTVLVRYSWIGDVNLDGVVNALDFNALASNFGGASGRVWTQGDFNYDGITNTADFSALASNFNQPLFASPPLGTVVPESSMLLISAASLAAIRRRRR